jgi:hypothetical protein
MQVFSVREADMFDNDDDDAIYAVALLTRSEVTALGPAFNRLWPVEKAPCFGELLAAIDDADRQLWRAKHKEEPPRPSILKW